MTEALAVTFFDDFAAKSLQRRSMSLEQLAAMIQSTTRRYHIGLRRFARAKPASRPTDPKSSASMDAVTGRSVDW